MQNLLTILKTALALVRADASKQILPLFKTMVTAIATSGFDPVVVIAQGDLFLASVAALAPTLTAELKTELGNALIAWADSTTTLP